MIEYFKYFFDPGHLFSLRPRVMGTRAIVILAVVFALFVILGVVSKIMTAKVRDGLKRKGWERLFHLFLTMGILGLLYLFFAWQGIALLASRFWLIILGVIFLAWLGFILKYMLIDIPKRRKEIEKKKNFNKYIP